MPDAVYARMMHEYYACRYLYYTMLPIKWDDTLTAEAQEYDRKALNMAYELQYARPSNRFPYK